MCGRYNVIDDPFTEALLEELGIRTRLRTAYNIAPTEQVQVIRSAQGRNELVDMRWWLIPSWVKEPGTRYSMFNARAETLSESPAFRAPLRHQRCILPASSFIEWRLEGGSKQPYEIRPVSGALAFAGLWDQWSQGDEAILSCTLVTTESAPGMEQVHNRQPVMLPQDALAQWLDPEVDGRELTSLLWPGIPDELDVTAVDPQINNSRHKQPPQALSGGDHFRIEG